jgi:hypothetical protein
MTGAAMAPESIFLARAVLLLGLVGLLGWSSGEKHSEAPPNVVMFYGGGLDKRVIVTDMEEIGKLFTALAQRPAAVSKRELQGRQFLSVAFYWWFGGLPSKEQLERTLRPEDAHSRTKLYLGIGHRDPVFIWPWRSDRPAARLVGLEAIEILRRWGVEVMQPSRNTGSSASPTPGAQPTGAKPGRDPTHMRGSHTRQHERNE